MIVPGSHKSIDPHANNGTPMFYTTSRISSTRLVDFFEELITFLHDESNTSNRLPSESILVYDMHLIQMVSKGKATKGGSDEFGLAVKAAHSSDITWAELIRHLLSWCGKDETMGTGMIICNAPMFAVVSFAPLLVQGGRAYLMNLYE